MGDFVKFLGKYAGELRAASGIFGLILRALPLDPADKRRAVDVLDNLSSAADRIEASIPRIMADGQVNRDDLKIVAAEVIREMLPDILAGATESATRAGARRARPSRAKKKAAPAAEGSTGA